MELGIFARTFPGSSPSEVFESVNRHGLHHIQYNMHCSGLSPLPLHISALDIQSVKEACTRFDIVIEGISATYNMVDPVENNKRAGRMAFQEIARMAAQVDCRLISVCTGSKHETDKWAWHDDNAEKSTWREMIREMELLVVVAEEMDVSIGVELEKANVVDSLSKAKKLCEEVPSDRIRFIIDPANLFERADDRSEIRRLIAESVQGLSDKLAMVHAKDRKLNGQICAPGEGDIDFRYFVDLLREVHFSGSVIMHGFGEGQVARATHFMRQVLNG